MSWYELIRVDARWHEFVSRFGPSMRVLRFARPGRVSLLPEKASGTVQLKTWSFDLFWVCSCVLPSFQNCLLFACCLHFWIWLLGKALILTRWFNRLNAKGWLGRSRHLRAPAGVSDPFDPDLSNVLAFPTWLAQQQLSRRHFLHFSVAIHFNRFTEAFTREHLRCFDCWGKFASTTFAAAVQLGETRPGHLGVKMCEDLHVKM